MIFGWIIIVPPFIAMYNTAMHVRGIEERIERLEKTVGAAVDLLHRVLHRDRPAKPGTPAGR